MVSLGVTAFPIGTIKAVFKPRIQGSGYDRNSGAETAIIPINLRTFFQFILPKKFIFFVAPPPLPPTALRFPGPYCLPPHPCVRKIPTDDCLVPLEYIREGIAKVLERVHNE